MLRQIRFPHDRNSRSTAHSRLSDPTNLIQVVLHGISISEGAPGLVMPSYASALTNADIARLAAYLRRSRTDRPPWTGLEKKVAAIRQQTASSQ